MQTEQFKELLADEATAHGLAYKFDTSIKENRTEEVIILGCGNIRPSINIQKLYFQYLGGNIEDIGMFFEAAVEEAEQNKGLVSEALQSLDFVIIMELVNTEANKELLREVPHREMMDMSIIYRKVLPSNDKVFESFIIRNSPGIKETDLYEMAMENRTDAGANMAHIMDFLRDSLNLNMDGINMDMPIYVASNKYSQFGGAEAFLNKELLAELAGKENDDLYILPSSIHETILVPAYFIPNAEYASMMVQEINQEEVDVSERLSNNVYLYSRETGEIEQVTDVPAWVA